MVINSATVVKIRRSFLFISIWVITRNYQKLHNQNKFNLLYIYIHHIYDIKNFKMSKNCIVPSEDIQVLIYDIFSTSCFDIFVF